MISCVAGTLLLLVAGCRGEVDEELKKDTAWVSRISANLRERGFATEVSFF